jgi:hypothetical protein
LEQQRLLLEAEARQRELEQQKQRQADLKARLLRQKLVLEQLSQKQKQTEKKLVEIKASSDLRQQQMDNAAELDNTVQTQTDGSSASRSRVSKTSQARETPAFSTDPCSGPSARFVSRCRK